MRRQKICAECGNPRSQCSDPETSWFPQRSICWATASQAAFQRMYQQMHEDIPFHDGTWSQWSKTPSRQTPYRFDDGVTIWAALKDYTPEDDFLGSNSTEMNPDDVEE